MIGRKICAFYVFLLCLALCNRQINAARILGFFPTPSKSHMLIHGAVADTLARAGHDVTVIGISKNIYPNAKYKFIEIKLNEAAEFHSSILQNMVNKPKPIYINLFSLADSFGSTVNRTLSHPKMKDFLRTHGAGAFDLVLLGYIFNDFAMGLGAHFDCPIILSFVIQTVFSTNFLVGNPSEYTYVPTMLSNTKQPLTFWWRVLSFFDNFFEQWIVSPTFEIKMSKIYR